jgi:sortase A
VIGGDQAAKPSGESVALLWFERPGENPPVTDKTYVVVSGVTLADLAQGPGHYPQTAAPGEAGNFAVAGHRTTHGAPFFRLDELREGDEIHVVDRQGDEHVYAFREQRIVAPTNLDVLGSEPIPDAQGIITLTTCHPRFSNSQRLIVFGELQ